MNLADFTIVYSGGLGSGPASRKFSELGVTDATFESVAGGDDFAEITVDVDINKAGMPFKPLARHSFYDGGGTLRFVGWLMLPARAATPDRQQQTFRLEGPNSCLAQSVFQQPWNYAADPTDYNSTLAPQTTPRVLLCRQDYASGERVDLRAQVKQMLDYYVGLFNSLSGAPIQYGSLAALPDLQPPEDEQTDTFFDTILKRLLRYAPKVTAYWSYPDVNPPVPMLNFSANDAVPAASLVGSTAPISGGGVGFLSLGEHSIIIDAASGTLTGFQSRARYDLLVRKFTVYYQAEREVTDDGMPGGKRKVWATLTPETSVVENGSTKEFTYCFDLRGAGGERDPVTGLLETPQEAMPTGLAAALHEPFKVLTHSLQWSVVGQDVDWSTPVGAAVGVRNAGDELLLGSRSILQRISRDIRTGTTTYQAGPPAHLSTGDMLALTRFNKTRNAARNSGASAGGDYSKSGGPNQQDTGKTCPADRGGGALGPNWFNCVSNGQVAVVLVNASVPVLSAAIGVPVVNPD